MEFATVSHRFLTKIQKICGEMRDSISCKSGNPCQSRGCSKFLFQTALETEFYRYTALRMGQANALAAMILIASPGRKGITQADSAAPSMEPD